MNSDNCVLRVTVPKNLRKTIQDIKEIAGKHSDDDIYAMLKECNMDPNETAQKLLYIDTFHEVKKKRDKRKSNVVAQSSVQPGLTSSMQRRGPRGGRGNNSSTYFPNDAGRRRQVNGRQENGGTNPTKRNANLLLPAQHGTESNAACGDTNSSVAPANEPRSASNGSSLHQHISQISADNISDVGSVTSVAEVHWETSDAVVNKLVKNPALPTVAVKLLPNVNPGPTPTPTPTTISSVSSGARFDGRNSESRFSHLPTSMNSASPSGVYSSASDPVLLPSLNPWNPGAMGAIKRETGAQRSATENIGSSSESRLNTGQDGRNNGRASSGTPNRTSQGIEMSQNSEHPTMSSLLNHDRSCAAISKQDLWSNQQVNGPSEVVKSLGEPVAHGPTMQSLPKLTDSVLEQATSQLDMKKKLKISTRQPVIFPDHIQVPEAFRNELTFGSLNDALRQTQNGIKNSKCVNETVLSKNDAASEPPLCHQAASSAAHDGDYPTHSQMNSNAPENLSPLEVNTSSAAASKSGQLKPEILEHISGSQYSSLRAAPDYSFGFAPPMLGPHLMQVEATEVENLTVPSTSGSSQPATQPVGVGQNTAAVSPQLFPFFRQPYPSNYVPYNPYFPQLYVPQNAHQFLGHSGFPQQTSTGNIYMPPPAAATGVKFPVPSLYNSGTFAGTLAHFGIPSGYGSYGSSAVGVGYGPGATITPGSSANNEDLAAPELKEKNIYSTLQQSEESLVWTCATGRDMSTSQANFFCNFPQGQQVAFSPAYSGPGPMGGMYRLTQTTVQSLPQQSQAIGGSVESVVPSTGTYQQAHSHINWNSKLLNRENI